MGKLTEFGWRVEKQIRECKRIAKDRGITWSLSDDEARTMIVGRCHYSGDTSDLDAPHGIDRLDPLKGYVPGNCVTACKQIIKLKDSIPEGDFWRIIRVCYEWKYSRS